MESLGNLTPEQRRQLQSLLHTPVKVNPGQLLGQGWDALNVAVEAPAPNSVETLLKL